MGTFLIIGIVSGIIFGAIISKLRGTSAARPPNLTARAEAIRGAPKPYPTGPDGNTAWSIAEKQCKIEAEFATYVLLVNNHRGPVLDKADAYRRALQATVSWHGDDPANPPTAEIFDILHKEDAASP